MSHRLPSGGSGDIQGVRIDVIRVTWLHRFVDIVNAWSDRRIVAIAHIKLLEVLRARVLP